MSRWHAFLPKSYLCFKSGYSFSLFKKDLLAGITVGVIALPLAMAFGIASGVTPERGLFTAIVAGFLISALGGSKAQIGGPTGAFVVIIYDIIQRTGYSGLAISTCLAAGLLILLGVLRLGSWIKYVPHSLITGFTAGLALLIFSSQIKDFFGLQMGTTPIHFFDKWMAYFTHMHTFQPAALALGLGTLAIILAVRRYFPSLPWGIIAISLATCAYFLFDLPVPTIHSRFGAIPDTLPLPVLPSFSVRPEQLPELFTDAITIAFLGAIESLLSAVIADRMTGDRHNSNGELVAQGIANFASILFGGIPATGAIARTAANAKSGAQTPVAGMIHALTLLLIILFLAPLVSYIPLPALSAVLIMVAWNMSELPHFIHLLKAPVGDKAVLLTAFFLTVFVDITAAICLGMALASFLFMNRMTKVSQMIPLTQKQTDDPSVESILKHKIPDGVEVYEIQGPFFFGTADLLKDLLSHSQPSPQIFILRMQQVPLIDASGVQALKEFYLKCQKSQITLLLSCLPQPAAKDLKRYGLYEWIGSDCILPDFDTALEVAQRLQNSTTVS